MTRARPLLVLVMGTARSGSTVTDLALGSVPRAFSCGEVSAWFRPWRPHHLDLRCGCGDPDCDVWTDIANVGAREFHAALVERLDVDVVVDSSKAVSWIIDAGRWARRRDIDVAAVVTWKEPKDLAFSFYKRDPRPASIEAAMRAFEFYYTAALGLATPKVAVRNVDLRDRPDATVSSLCAVLGIDAGTDRHEFWRHEHHHLFGSSSASEQVLTRERLVETEPTADFEEAWDRLGYARDDAATELRAALSAIDVGIVDRPVPGPVGTRSAGSMSLAAIYAKQRLLGVGRRLALHARTRRLRLRV